jgi:hypothetical protein
MGEQLHDLASFLERQLREPIYFVAHAEEARNLRAVGDGTTVREDLTIDVLLLNLYLLSFSEDRAPVAVVTQSEGNWPARNAPIQI